MVNTSGKCFQESNDFFFSFVICCGDEINANSKNQTVSSLLCLFNNWARFTCLSLPLYIVNDHIYPQIYSQATFASRSSTLQSPKVDCVQNRCLYVESLRVHLLSPLRDYAKNALQSLLWLCVSKGWAICHVVQYTCWLHFPICFKVCFCNFPLCT